MANILNVYFSHDKIGERYFWPGYAKDVKLFCEYCTTCRWNNKMPIKTDRMHLVGIPRKPFTQWKMDLGWCDTSQGEGAA